MNDFSDFRPANTHWLWYSDNLSETDVAKLPLGASFWALYGPVVNFKQWTLIHFRIQQVPEIEAIAKATGRKSYRGYVQIETVLLEAAPFEWQPLIRADDDVKPLHNAETDIEAEWLDYMQGAEPSAAVLARLETLGSYERNAA